jgi:hypothetical protein
VTATTRTVAPGEDATDRADGADAPDAADPAHAGARGPWYSDGLALLLAGALGLMAAPPVADNSVLTHLATGRLFLDEGIPATNPFLYSSTDFPIPSWWWSGVLAIVDRVAGGTGIRILTVLLAAALGALLVRLARPAPGEDPTATGVLSVVVPVAFAYITLMLFLTARPHLPGFLLLGITVLVVRERRSPWWLVPVFATWVNIHGTWFYGLLVLGLLVVCDVIDRRQLSWRQLWAPVAALGGVVLGGLVYPETFRLVGLPFEQFGDERARKALSAYVEWAPAGWSHPLTWILLAMGLAALFGGIRRRDWGTALGSVGLVAMGLSAGRLVPLAAITLVPWVAAGLAGIGGSSLPRGRVAAALAATGAVLLGVGLAWAVRGPSYDLHTYPVAAVDWLDARGLVGRPDVKVATHDYAGNYLDWRYGRGANTFMDDRAGTDTALDYLSMLRLEPDWRQALRRADPDVLIWEDGERLTKRLAGSDNWYRAGSFDGFTVLCRNSIADRCR